MNEDQVKGKAKQGEGKAQEAWGDAKEKADDLWDDAKRKLRDEDSRDEEDVADRSEQ